MEDRKRPSGDDLAPPTKRQAVNGNKSSADSDMPWAADLEVCTPRFLCQEIDFHPLRATYRRSIIAYLYHMSASYTLCSSVYGLWSWC